jgi:hypothetical protein
MGEILVFAVSLVANAAIPYAIVKYDLERLSPERLSRAWNDASFLSAVVLFGPLSVLVHFARTRRSLAGWALGLGLAAGAILCGAVAQGALSLLLGVD